MPYDPAESLPRDLARGLLGDTDNRKLILVDATYDSVIARYAAGPPQGGLPTLPALDPPTLGAMLELAERCAQEMRLRATSERQGPLSLSYGDRARGFEMKAAGWLKNGLPGQNPVVLGSPGSASGRMQEPDTSPLTRHL